MAGTTHDIAIVGGGTAGAASALLLARAGHRVTLFERVAEPSAVGAGILLQPTGMQVLRTLGLLEQVQQHGARVTRLFGTCHYGWRALDVRYADWNREAYGLGLHRGVLFSVLWNALRVAGVEVAAATHATKILQNADKAELWSDDTLLGSFDCVIVADGTRSQLRHQLPITQNIRAYPWGALWAVVPDEGLTPGVLRQWFRHAEQMLGLMPTGFAYRKMDKPVISLFWSLRADRLPAWRAVGLDAWKQSVLALAPMIRPALDHITSVEQLTWASYADVRMPYWHHGRAVCIGDCAHATSPQLGQGANLALVDAMTLAQSFAAGGSVPVILANYSEQRRAHLRYYQDASKLLTPYFQSDSRAGSTLRDLGLGLLCRMPFVRQQMARTLSGSKTGWLSGSLALTEPNPEFNAGGPATTPPVQTPVPPGSPATR
jgi:2-polyprenyl-6-methoxyphenol hydroxylase-like FAD-dependent oxidoreductase